VTLKTGNGCGGSWWAPEVVVGLLGLFSKEHISIRVLKRCNNIQRSLTDQFLILKMVKDKGLSRKSQKRIALANNDFLLFSEFCNIKSTGSTSLEETNTVGTSQLLFTWS
jgi:hypothetical protein